ncbi:MAG: acyl-CoA dehydrogenase family protein [Thermodesulfobacteriota bacterium]
MAEFGFNETHQDLQNAAREFATKELAPGAKERALSDFIPVWMIKKIAELGYTGMIAEEKYGGQGMDMMSVGIVAEEFGKVDIASTGVVIIPTQICALLKSGTEEQRQQWIPLLCKGEMMPSLAITEPDCGTDAAAIKMRAIGNAENYILEGEKAPVTRATQSNVLIVWAKTDINAGARGVSCFFVPSDSPGLTLEEIPYAGLHPFKCCAAFFDSVKVPIGNRIGDEGKGFYMLMDRFDVIRVLLALVALGQAQTSLSEVTAYVKSRTAFGRPVVKFEAISFKIAEGATKLDAARLLCYRALWMRDQGIKHSKEAAMCKWYAPVIAFEVIHDCILMMGHYGYSNDYPLIQRMLDVLGYQIADGTAEAQKLVIVRDMIGRQFLPYSK